MRFLLIDRIVTLEPGHRATGVKTIAPDEDYFQDHFPGYPVVPGVLLLESMAQLGGRLIEATVRDREGSDVLPVLAMVRDARFQMAVRPGDCLDVSAELKSLNPSAARVLATITVNGRSAASAEIAYGLLRPQQESTGLSHEDLERLRRWSRDVWKELCDEPFPPGPRPPAD